MPLAFPKPCAVRSEAYLAWIRLFKCLVCGSSDVEAAHTGEHGLRTKSPDIQTIPLCVMHHRGPVGLDSIGAKEFERRYNVDLKARILYFVNLYIAEHLDRGRVRF